MATSVSKTLDQAFEQLRRDPTRPVRTEIGGLTIELRQVAKPVAEASESAADVFRRIGRWEGESFEEIRAILTESRREAVGRDVRDL